MKTRSTTQKMALIAVMADISIIFHQLSLRTGTTQVTLYGLPLLLTGMMFGPLIGGLSGLVVGFITQMLQYGPGPTTAIWMIAPLMWGLTSGLLTCAFKKELKLFNIIIIVMCTALIVTGSNSLAMYLDGLIIGYPTPYVLTEMGIRILFSMLTAIVNITLCYFTLGKLKKLNLSK